MQKRGLQLVFLIFITLVLSISFSYAQEATSTSTSDTSDSEEESDSEDVEDETETEDVEDETRVEGDNETPDEELEDITEEDINDELGTGGSVNGFDRFVDRIIKDDEGYSRERAAEIRTLLSEGKYEEAKALLSEYEQSAEKFEKEVNPEDRDSAERRSRVIRKAYGDVINDLPPEYRDDFNKIRVAEKKIGTAAEIAGKIKELCETLAKVDPDQYSRTCKTDEDSPEWQKRLDKDLTDEQKKEAKAFIGIMTQCMRDAENCKCQDISVKAFADKCSEVVPLYAQCQKGDEAKCEEADNLSNGIEDSLPDYLQEALADLEDDFNGAQFDNHMPPECKEAGANDRKSCELVMIKTNAPEECVSAMESGKIKFENERQFRKDCEEIMFNENAPQECIDAGIKDHRECGKFMFKQSAPQECIDAGLTGESPKDGRKCQEIMDKFRGEREGPEGRGPSQGGFNFDCRQIQDSNERLKCFDGAVSSFREGPEGFNGERFNEDEFRKIKEKERECANSCQEKNAAWDFTGGQCTCRAGEQREFRDDRRFEERREAPPYNCATLNCGQGSYCDPYSGCRSGGEQYQQPPQEQQTQQQPSGDSNSDSTSGTTSGGSTSTDSGSSSTSSGGDSSSSSSTSSSSSGEESAPVTGSAITGNVVSDISQGNGFLSYLFGR